MPLRKITNSKLQVDRSDVTSLLSLFQIAAIALIAVGAYVQVKLVDYYDFFGNQYTGPGILMIVVGVFIFFIAFFGCMGAMKENYCLTMSVS